MPQVATASGANHEIRAPARRLLPLRWSPIERKAAARPGTIEETRDVEPGPVHGRFCHCGLLRQTLSRRYGHAQRHDAECLDILRRSGDFLPGRIHCGLDREVTRFASCDGWVMPTEASGVCQD